MRIEKTAQLAKELDYDYFCTTLTVSPYKNAKLINEIGIKYSEKYKVKWLYSDFKKDNGYKHSIELSKIYNLYRQDYCGCIYSKNEREESKTTKGTPQRLIIGIEMPPIILEKLSQLGIKYNLLFG